MERVVEALSKKHGGAEVRCLHIAVDGKTLNEQDIVELIDAVNGAEPISFEELERREA